MNRISHLLHFIDSFESDPSPDDERFLQFTGGCPLDSDDQQSNQFRHFDPTPGLWITADPVGYDATPANLRPYVSSPRGSGPG